MTTEEVQSLKLIVWLAVGWIVGGILAGIAAGYSDALPTDPLQRTATKALAGRYGTLQDWQREGYERAIRERVTVQGSAWLTSYYPQEGFWKGKPTASGEGVSSRSMACAKWRFKRWFKRYVWTQASGIRVVEDCGADRNERVAKRSKGCWVWLDRWTPTRERRNYVTAYAVW